MLTLHWTLQIHAPKSKNTLLDTKASAYPYEELYRICFSNQKQKYYFEITGDFYFKDEIKEAAEKYFIEHRDELTVAKCIRCYKWDVIEGQFCPRCQEAIKLPGNTEYDIET